MNEYYQNYSPKQDTLDLIDEMNGIIERYRQQGYDLSLRQLYYQLVAAGLIENTERSYSRIGKTVTRARLGGLMDWDVIVDRNRSTEMVSTWDSPAEILHVAANTFRMDLWRNQEWHVEVMVEKDALSGILAPVCNQLCIRFTANKGYPSVSLLRLVGRRIARMREHNKRILILHLGDHDPSGIDMTRDLEERIGLFAKKQVNVARLALNMDQVERYDPPPNPAKMTDSRASGYVEEFGYQSWELDALPPDVLADLVRDRVKKLIDEKQWEEDEAIQLDHKKRLLKVSADWN